MDLRKRLVWSAAIFTSVAVGCVEDMLEPDDEAVAEDDVASASLAAVNVMNASNVMNVMNSMNASNVMNVMNVMNSVNAVNAMAAMNAMDALNTTSAIQPVHALNVITTTDVTTTAELANVSAGPSLAPGGISLANFGDLTPYMLDHRCVTTSIDYTLPDGTPVKLQVPKFLVLQDQFEVLKDDTGVEVTITINESGSDVVYRVLYGIGLACADRGYRPLFLSPTPAGSTTIRLFESDLRYMCFQLKDPNTCQRSAEGACPAPCARDLVVGTCDVPYGEAPTNPTYGEPVWFCGKGTLADGVSGYAVKGDKYARPFLAQSISWGGNTWSRQYQFMHGTGSISERTPAGSATGYALDLSWGLNPNDTHADGRSKVKDYLAGLAVKTATNRTGVIVSPYNNANRSGGEAFDVNELNECEQTGPYSYFNRPDIASSGEVVNGVLLDLQAGTYYHDPNTICDWGRERGWNLSAGPIKITKAANGRTCKVFDTTLETGPVMGLNLWDPLYPRCPELLACAPGEACCQVNTLTGKSHSCMQRADGTLWCWGDNTYGQLGDGTTTSSTVPVQVRFADGSPLHDLFGIAGFTVGDEHTCAISLIAGGTNSRTYCWGRNDKGQLGDNSTTHRSNPVPVVDAAGNSFPLLLVINAGAEHTCATQFGGTPWCWGGNSWGQLGNGGEEDSWVPVQVKRSSTSNLTAISGVTSGGRHNCARRSDATAWCWGANDYGQLGAGAAVSPTAKSSYALQVKVDSTTKLRRMVDVRVSGRNSCFIDAGLTLWCAGDGTYGQNGDGTTTTRNYVVRVRDADGSVFQDARQISVNNLFACAQRPDRSAWCWGRNNVGQLGNGTTSSLPTTNPVRVRERRGSMVTKSLGLAWGSDADHTCFRDRAGRSYCWGDNSRGQLGDGTRTNRSSATLIPGVTCQQ